MLENCLEKANVAQIFRCSLQLQDKSRSIKKPFFAFEKVWLLKVTVTKGLDCLWGCGQHAVAGQHLRCFHSGGQRPPGLLWGLMAHQVGPPKSGSKFEVAGQSRFKQSLRRTSCCHKASHLLRPEELECCYQIYCVVGVQGVLWAGNTFKFFCTYKNKPKLYQVIKAGLLTSWPTAAIFTLPCRWSSMLVKLKVAWDLPWNSQS